MNALRCSLWLSRSAAPRSLLHPHRPPLRFSSQNANAKTRQGLLRRAKRQREAEEIADGILFENNVPFSYLRYIGRPFLFTVGTAAAAYGAAFYASSNKSYGLELFREQEDRRMAQMQLLMEKYSGNYEWLKLWMRANFSNPERLALSVIAFNTAVFVLWRIPPLTRFMSRWFLHAPFAGRPITLLTSAFSHKSFAHFLFNNIAFWSFVTPIYYQLGQEQFLAFSATAAVVAGFASQVASVVRKSFIPGLGMSGIIMAYLAMTAVLQPEAEFTIIFFPFVNFSAMDTLRAIMLIDVVGLVLGWTALGHAAHLGGACFGYWYAKHGHDVVWSLKNRVLKSLGLRS